MNSLLLIQTKTAYHTTLLSVHIILVSATDDHAFVVVVNVVAAVPAAALGAAVAVVGFNVVTVDCNLILQPSSFAAAFSQFAVNGLSVCETICLFVCPSIWPAAHCNLKLLLIDNNSLAVVVFVFKYCSQLLLVLLLLLLLLSSLSVKDLSDEYN